MPSIKDFEKKKKAQEIQKKAEHKKEKKEAKSKSEDYEMETPKRRPSKETHGKSHPNLASEPENIVSAELSSQDSVEEKDSISSENAAGAESMSSTSSTSETEDPVFEQASSQIHVEFPGSFILRSKFGKAFETMDKVATDWVNDGDFEGLPVGHPLLQIAAAKSLKKAKDLEKKAQNTQVYALAKIGFEYAKSKLKK